MLAERAGVRWGISGGAEKLGENVRQQDAFLSNRIVL